MKKLLNGDIWQVKLYPVRGSEQDGIRPCLIVSPDSMNRHLQTVIVVPLTRSHKDWPTRSMIQVKDEAGQACLEYIRSVSIDRFIKKISSASDLEMADVRRKLHAIFEE